MTWVCHQAQGDVAEAAVAKGIVGLLDAHLHQILSGRARTD